MANRNEIDEGCENCIFCLYGRCVCKAKCENHDKLRPREEKADGTEAED